MIYLNKIIPNFFYPITFVLILMLWSIFTKRRLPLLIAFFVLWLGSMPLVSHLTVAYLEGGQLRRTPSTIPNADVIVVLSGMLSIVNSSTGPIYEWGDPDRFFAGVELMRINKAKYLLFTGGKLPWDKISQSEGQYLAKFASQFGIAADQIEVTEDVQNTAQEARAVKTFLDKRGLGSVILVTSNFHMERAIKLFENEKIIVYPYPVDSRVGASQLTPMDFLPDASSFSSNQFVFRELIGRAYYRIRYRDQ